MFDDGVPAEQCGTEPLDRRSQSRPLEGALLGINTKQNQTGNRCHAPKDEFSEILVLGQQDAALGLRAIDRLPIRRAGALSAMYVTS
ncbi:MAG TPA: hypothetical protein VMB81_02775 [Candidatus Sulfotelmatobacter sp.]|nr:hypothetical protein [Candidatus Sulfotelmatobacter sp.]